MPGIANGLAVPSEAVAKRGIVSGGLSRSNVLIPGGGTDTPVQLRTYAPSELRISVVRANNKRAEFSQGSVIHTRKHRPIFVVDSPMSNV